MENMFTKMTGGKVEDMVEGAMNKVMGKDGKAEEKGGFGVSDAISMAAGAISDKKEVVGSNVMGALGGLFK